MSISKKLFFIAILAVLLSGGISTVVFAQSADANKQLNAFAGDRGASYGTPRDPRLVAAYIIKISLGLLGMAFLGYMLYAGYLILMARGDEAEVEKGKETLKTAVIGIVIILASYGVTLLVARIATNNKSTVEPLFNDDQPEGLRVRPNPTDFMPTDPLR